MSFSTQEALYYIDPRDILQKFLIGCVKLDSEDIDSRYSLLCEVLFDGLIPLFHSLSIDFPSVDDFCDYCKNSVESYRYTNSRLDIQPNTGSYESICKNLSSIYSKYKSNIEKSGINPHHSPATYARTFVFSGGQRRELFIKRFEEIIKLILENLDNFLLEVP